jgi:hypothetical protein
MEVIEPSSSFVRAGVFTEGSPMVVFRVDHVHCRRHINFLIRPGQQTQKSNQGRDSDNARARRKTTIIHSATVPFGIVALIFENSSTCELPPFHDLDSLPPSSRIRPPSLT